MVKTVQSGAFTYMDVLHDPNTTNHINEKIKPTNTKNKIKMKDIFKYAHTHVYSLVVCAVCSSDLAFTGHIDAYLQRQHFHLSSSRT